MLGLYRHASETPFNGPSSAPHAKRHLMAFRWQADDTPLIVFFGSSQKIKFSKLKRFGSAHESHALNMYARLSNGTRGRNFELSLPLLPYIEPYASSEDSGETVVLLENAISKVSETTEQVLAYRKAGVVLFINDDILL